MRLGGNPTLQLLLCKAFQGLQFFLCAFDHPVSVHSTSSSTCSLTLFILASDWCSGSASLYALQAHSHPCWQRLSPFCSQPHPGRLAPPWVFHLDLPHTRIVPTSFSFLFLILYPSSKSRSLVEDAVTFPWAPSGTCHL